jgi:hypothetical protein
MTTYFKQGLDVTGNVNLTGNITVGGDQNFGDANTDSITFTSDITSNMLPDVSLTYNLGSTTKQWNNLYVNDVIADNNISVGGTITSTNTSEHNLGKVVINDDQISVSTGNELKLSSPANLILEPTDNIWISAGTKLIFEGTAPDDFEIKLQATAVTADREIILPDAEGTLALQSYVDQAETDAISTAATDATTKSDQALVDAKAYTDTRETSITTAYQTYTDTAVASSGGGGSEIQYGQAGASGATLNPGDTAVIKLLGDLTGNSVGVVLSRNLDGNDRLIDSNFSPSAYATYTNNTGSAITGVAASLLSNPVNYMWFIDRA